MMQYRRVERSDLERVMEIICQARMRLRNAGSSQWQDGYPEQSHIEADIARKCGVAACNPDGQIVAYAAVIFDGEPAYGQIDGAWIGTCDYVVVHRLAVADQAAGKGAATEFMHYIMEMAHFRGFHSFRIDTAHENRIMQQMLQTLGFTPCGEIYYAGGCRLAFEKLL